ncbi:uncharacterized protein LOC141950199 isoform X2 [Strix uralensis]|uniref:uncharacterized protein LOC141950198 isoform X2 n=1 Tax=Strix uralensis TaxID=36305 RepID=UPI003DA3F326
MLAPRCTVGAVVFAHSAARQLRPSRARAARHSPRYRRGPAAHHEGRFWGGFVRFPAGCPRLPQDRCARAPAVRMRGGGPRRCRNPQALPKPARGALGVHGCGVAAFPPHPSASPVGTAEGSESRRGLCVLQVTWGHLDPQSKSSSEVCRSIQTQAKEERERGPLRNIFLGSRLGRLTPWGRVEQRRCRGARSRGTIYAPKSDRGSEQGTVRRCKAGYRHRR